MANGTTTSVGDYVRANRTFFLFVLLLLVTTTGYFWWRSGFTFDVSRFFASCNPDYETCGGGYCGDGYCDNDEDQNSCSSDCGSPGCTNPDPLTCGGDNDCDDDNIPGPPFGDDCDDSQCSVGGGCGTPSCQPTIRTCNGDNVFQHYSNCNGENVEFCSNGCDPGNGSNASCQGEPPPTPTPTGGTPTPTPGGSCPCGAGSWSENGVTVCKSGGNIDSSDRCSFIGPNQQADITVTICNGSSQNIYSKSALFFSPQQTCGAHADNPTSANVSGATSLDPGQVGQTTYSFNTGSCGSWQLDDTWGPGNFAFVIGFVINTEVNCGPPPSHLECQNNACVSVAGGGSNLCSSNADCGSPQTHLECQANACVSVSGAGGNLCSSNADCAVTTTTPTPPPTTAPPLPTLQCISTVSQSNIGQAVEFRALGGTGSYSWFAPGGAPATGGGQGFSSAYSLAGFKTVTVVSGGDQATCTVTILAPPTPNELICQPPTQNATSGQPATVTAAGGTPNYTWSAPDGVPASQRDGTSFTTTFTTTEPARTFPVTVTDSAGRSAVCNVNVSCPVPQCPAPPEGCSYQGGNICACGTLVCPSEAPLVCAPANQTVGVGQAASFQVAGGSVRTYSWSAPSGNPSSAAGPNTTFATTYGSAGSYIVTVAAGDQSATCSVVVQATVSPTTPPPTAPALTIQKTVRNVTAGGSEQESVNAEPTQTVEFTIRVSSVGSGTATQVMVRDVLPAGLTYQAGTTTVDNAPAADGIIGSGLNVGDMPPGRTITVRFRALVAPADFFALGSTTLVDTAYARASNTAEVSDTAVVTVTRGSTSMSLTKLGRNVTRGQTGENTPVYSDPAQTIEFIVRVRNTSATTLTNVTVRDVLPQNIAYVPGTAKVNGQPASDTLMTSGINIGSLTPNQEAVITFNGRVANAADLPSGTTTRINTAYAVADTVPQLSAQLPVIITRTGPPVTQVPTGPGDTTILALIISAVITLLYVGYTSTDVYRRREVEGLAGHKDQDRDTLDFKR